MTHYNNPWSLNSILRFVGLLQVLDPPVILIGHHLHTIVGEVIKLSRETNKVYGTHVEAKVHVFSVARHGESLLVVAKVTGIVRALFYWTV